MKKSEDQSSNSNDHHPLLDSNQEAIDSHSINSNEPPPPPSRLLVFSTVSFYLVAALVMVCVNKWVLNSNPVPLFLLFCQLVIAVILLKLSGLVGLIKLPKNLFKNLLNSNNQFKLLRAVSPLVLINSLGLIFNTYCLKFVDASFYQVARGLILPFTVLASYLAFGTKSSLQINLSIVVVCMGFMVGVSSERLTVSHLGVFLGVLSSITTAVHAIVVKKSLEKIPSTIALTYYSNALSALVVLPLIIILGETPEIFKLFSSGYDQLRTFLWGTLLTGLFGFLICIAGFLSIKVTSPVTHMISSAVRGVIQTVLGVLLFGDKITTGRMGGIGLILTGSIYYTWRKDQDLNVKKAGSENQYVRLKSFADPREGEAETDEVDSLMTIQVDPPPPLPDRSPPIIKSPSHLSDHSATDPDDDDDDEDLRELRKAEKALGL